jgi:hypothetical protein
MLLLGTVKMRLAWAAYLAIALVDKAREAQDLALPGVELRRRDQQ